MRLAPSRIATRAALAACVMLAVAHAVSAERAQYHGAIGYSPATGAMGWSIDYPNAEEARNVAIKRCAEHAKDCTIAVEFTNGCGVVAEGVRSHAASGSDSRSEARRAALSSCRQLTQHCTVRRWVCTTRSKY